MNTLHPAVAPLLAAVCVGGRIACEQLSPAAGDAWQRGVEALAAAATIGVFLQFSAGDPPRRPWALLMLTAVFVVGSRAAAYLGGVVGDVQLAHLGFIVANVCVAVAMLAFNRLLGSSELLSERTDAARWKALTFVGLLALAAIVALGVGTWEVLARERPETSGAIVATTVSVVSTLSDVLVCTGGIYLVWLVRPLLGGSLARPYLLLAVSAGMSLVVDFLLADFGVSTQTEIGVASFSARLAKWLGTLAYALLGLAAATQLWLLRSAGRRQKSGPQGR